MGSFQIPTQDIKNKEKKITDFFAPISNKQTQKYVSPTYAFEPSQKMKEESQENLEKMVKNDDDDKLNNSLQDSDSEESIMLAFLRKKR